MLRRQAFAATVFLIGSLALASPRAEFSNIRTPGAIPTRPFPAASQSAKFANMRPLAASLIASIAAKTPDIQLQNRKARHAASLLSRFLQTLDSGAEAEFLSVSKEMLKEKEWHRNFLMAFAEEMHRVTGGAIQIRPPERGLERWYCTAIREIQGARVSEFEWAFADAPDIGARRHFLEASKPGWYVEWKKNSSLLSDSLAAKYGDGRLVEAGLYFADKRIDGMIRESSSIPDYLFLPIAQRFGEDGKSAAKIAAALPKENLLDSLRSETMGVLGDTVLVGILAHCERLGLIESGGWTAEYERMVARIAENGGIVQPGQKVPEAARAPKRGLFERLEDNFLRHPGESIAALLVGAFLALALIGSWHEGGGRKKY